MSLRSKFLYGSAAALIMGAVVTHHAEAMEGGPYTEHYIVLGSEYVEPEAFIATVPDASRTGELAQSSDKKPADTTDDPLEGYNRVMFSINDFLFQYLIGPIADVYTAVIPPEVRDSVGNVLWLMRSPVILGNDLLQGEWNRAWNTTQRIGLNATFGFVAIDLAGHMGIERHTEDFGQTLGSWGVGDYPYIVAPILGPTNPRDIVGTIVDSLADPLSRWADNTGRDGINYGRISMTIVHEYSLVKDDVDKLRKSSVDFYATIRSSWIQKRRADVRNQKPDTKSLPKIDYDVNLD